MKLFKLTFLLMLTPMLLLAEGGSVYTRYALGDLNYAYSARRMAMGGLGLAMYDQNDIGTLNPAAWSRITLTRFNIGLNYNLYGLKDNTTSANYSATQFSGFSLGIPVQKSYGISLVLGITPYSNVMYDVTEAQSATLFPHSLYFEGNGGISRSFLGLSYRLPFIFDIGASIDYYIGNIDYISGIDFSNHAILNTEFLKTYKLSGVGGTFGIISDDLLQYVNSGSSSELRLAFSYTLSQKFDADTSLVVTTYSNTREEPASGSSTDLATGKATVEIPSRMGIGLSFILNKAYNFLVDYYTQPWSQYKFTDQKVDNLRDLNKISFGLEYRNPDTRAAGFWEHVALRAGLSYEETQYVIKGTEINQFSVMGGFSIPLDNVNTLDFGVEYAARGSNDNNLVKENLVKLNLTLNLGELWFFRQ